MAIETTLQPRQKWWNLLYAVFCVVMGLWGAYDYWVKLPRDAQALADYTAAVRLIEATPNPTPDQRPKLAEAQATIDGLQKTYGGVPPSESWYDRPVQLWLWVIFGGVLGTPFFLWQWLAPARKKYRLDDDGTLHAPEGTFTADQIADIDMSKWMAKSKAWVVTKDGRRILLDDYKFRNMHLIVGSLAYERYPEAWTEDARDRSKLKDEEPKSSES